MMADLRRAVRAVTSLLVRAKVVSAAVQFGRVMVQVTALAGDVKNGVELLLPYGWTAIPKAGADLILLSMNGQQDHQVAIMADATGLRIAGMIGGDMGFSDGAQVVAMMAGKLVLTSENQIAATAPVIQLGALDQALHALIDARFEALFNEHTHHVNAVGAETNPPTQTLGSGHMTSTVVAG